MSVCIAVNGETQQRKEKSKKKEKERKTACRVEAAIRSDDELVCCDGYMHTNV